MACGATLKRPMEFEAALLSPGSPKRRRCAPLPGPTPGLRPPDAEPPPPPFQTQTPPQSLQQPAPPGSERRLPTPGNLRCCGLGRKPGPGIFLGALGEGWEYQASLPRDPFFALRKGNWDAAGPGCFRGWEASGRGCGATGSVFGFPGAGEPGGVDTKEEDGNTSGRSGPSLSLKPLLPPLAGSTPSHPADPVGHGELDSVHEPGLEGGGGLGAGYWEGARVRAV